MNNNDFYVSNSFNASSAFAGFIGGADRVNLTAIQTGFGQNTNSIFADPFFVSNTDLRSSLGSSVGAAGAVGTGVTTDFLSVTRGTPPSIGAYENVINPPPVITYTNLMNTTCTNDPTITATITDVHGIDTNSGTKPRLYYKRSSDNNTYTGNTSSDNGWKYVEASNASSPFTFTMDDAKLQAAYTIGDSISYFVLAQDNYTTPSVGISLESLLQILHL